MSNLAIVGATGLVGRMFLRVIEQYGLHFDNVKLFASQKSAGTTIDFYNQPVLVQSLSFDSFFGTDIALFSAGGQISKQYAPIAVQSGAYVIDNSSYWRMDANVPLVVPQINQTDLKDAKLIANPNCSTITAVSALNALKPFGLKSVRYTTFQAVSGAGKRGIDDLKNTLDGNPPQHFLHDISKTVIPHIDAFLPNGYTKEEQKMVDETRKILHLPTLPVSATCVRVPTKNCHAVSVNVELEHNFELPQIYKAFQTQLDIVLKDDPSKNIYPLATMANDTDQIYVGRVRRDTASQNGLTFFCVADNLRKGAASNAVQIAQIILQSSKN